MSERSTQFLRFYHQHRVEDQLQFYRSRLDQFDRATGQSLFISAAILGFASGAGALAAYVSLYVFEQQSKIYGDAVRAVRAAARLRLDPGTVPGDHDVSERVEQALRREQSQWGQLTSRIQLDDPQQEQAGG